MNNIDSFKKIRQEQIYKLILSDVKNIEPLKLVSKSSFRKQYAKAYKLPMVSGKEDLTLDEITEIYGVILNELKIPQDSFIKDISKKIIAFLNEVEGIQGYSYDMTDYLEYEFKDKNATDIRTKEIFYQCPLSSSYKDEFGTILDFLLELIERLNKDNDKAKDFKEKTDFELSHNAVARLYYENKRYYNSIPSVYKKVIELIQIIINNAPKEYLITKTGYTKKTSLEIAQRVGNKDIINLISSKLK